MRLVRAQEGESRPDRHAQSGAVEVLEDRGAQPNDTARSGKDRASAGADTRRGVVGELMGFGIGQAPPGRIWPDLLSSAEALEKPGELPGGVHDRRVAAVKQGLEEDRVDPGPG
jgi:hypothetical protein